MMTNIRLVLLSVTLLAMTGVASARGITACSLRSVDKNGGERAIPGYVNSNGVCVPRPEARPQEPGIGMRATAQCRDGTFSYSQHRSGTCSHHGGVASWM